MKISRRIRRSKWFKKFIAACLAAGMMNFTFLPAALALPQGGVVKWTNDGSMLGNVANSSLIQILTAKGVIIDWNSFSIGKNEAVKFDFSMSNGAVLNKVIGNDKSLISGLLEATNQGSVILVNPNGIVFGGGAQINTGAFAASTIDLSNDAFKKFIGGETDLLQFKQIGGAGGAVEITGTTYTNGNMAFIGSTINVAPGVTLSPSDPVANPGFIRLLAGKEVDLRATDSSHIYLYRQIADANNTIKIGGAAGGATVEAGGVVIHGGAVSIEGSENNPSKISSNSIYSLNDLSISALSEMNDETDYRESNVENLITIKNANLVSFNSTGATDIDVTGGKVQITDSTINANGIINISARSGRDGETTFAGSDNSATLENVSLDSVDSITIQGGKVQLTGTDINTGASLNMRAFTERTNPGNSLVIAGSDNSVTLENTKTNSAYDTIIMSGKAQITGSEIKADNRFSFMAFSEFSNAADYRTHTGDNTVTIENTKLSAYNYGDGISEIIGSKVQATGSDIVTNGNLEIIARSARQGTTHLAGPDNSTTLETVSLDNAGSIALQGGKIQVTDSDISTNGSLTMLSFTERKSDNSLIVAGAGNSINLENTEIKSDYDTIIRGGKVQINGESAVDTNNGFAIVAFSEINNVADSRTYTSENTVTIEKTDLSTNNYSGGIAEIYGGKIQVKDSNIMTNGSFEISARSSRQVAEYFAGSENSIALENVSLDSNGSVTLQGGNLQLTNADITTNGFLNMLAFSEKTSDNSFIIAGSENNVALENVKTVSDYGTSIRGGKIQMTDSEINTNNNNFTVMAFSEFSNAADYRTHTSENTVTIKNTDLSANNYGGNAAELIGSKVQVTDSNIITSGSFDIIARSARQGTKHFADLENSITLENVSLDSYEIVGIQGGKVQVTGSDINTNASLTMRVFSERESLESGYLMTTASDNSVTLDTVKITSDYDTTIMGGKVQITDSVINANSIVDVMAFSERYRPDSINTKTTAGTDNSITIGNSKLYGENSTKIRGGKLELMDSNIGTNGTLNIWAYSERTTFEKTPSGTLGNDSITTATTDNSITIKDTVLSGGSDGAIDPNDRRSAEIVGGKVEITGSTINTTDNLNIVAANSLETNANFSDATYKADVNNTLNINNSSVIADSYSRLRGLGGAIDISGSTLEGHGVALAAFEEMKNDQKTWPHDTGFIGESSSKLGVGNSVILRDNSSIVASSGSLILGGNIKLDQSSIASSGEYGANLVAASSYANSDSKMEQIYESTSKNIIEIGKGSSITNTYDAGEIWLLGGIINNNGTINANNGSASAIALSELKGSGTLEGAGGTIKFSGNGTEAGDYDYTYNGQTLTVTVEIDNPDKPQPTFKTSWDADGNITKTTIYLKPVLAPEDVGTDTPVDEVIKSIDNVLEKLENPATKDEALQEIETIFTNIQGKSDDDKKEIVDSIMKNTPDNEKKDVAQAIINGDGGNGAFTQTLETTNNETTTQNQPGQPDGQPGAPQQNMGNSQPGSGETNSEIAPGVSVEEQ